LSNERNDENEGEEVVPSVMDAPEALRRSLSSSR